MWEVCLADLMFADIMLTSSIVPEQDMEEFGKFAGKPGVPRVPGGNPFVTPDTTVHNPKEGDVELGKATTETVKP